MPESLPSKKPWPMKWIIVAILACIIPYTWLTLRYRKPGPAFEPYRDTKERVQLQRLIDAGVRRVPATVMDAASSTAAAPAKPPATARLAPGGLTETLSQILIDQPQLPLTISQIVAPATTRADAPYPIMFTYMTDWENARLSPGAAYLHEREVTVIVELDATGATSSERSSTAAIQLPPRLFGSGTYTVTLVGRNESQSWQVEAQ